MVATMYSPNADTDRFSSPFLAANLPQQQPSPLDTVRDIVAAHGKKIIVIIAVLAVLYFIADLFLLGFVPFSITVANAEHQSLESTISVFESGQSTAFKTATDSQLDLQLKKGRTYRVEVETGGYDSADETFTVGSEPSFDVVLSKPFLTTVKAVNFSPQIFLEQTVDGSVVLSNHGSKNESVELVFEGDWKDAVSGPPGPVLVPGGQDIPVNFSVQFPSNTVIKDLKKGDAKKGTVRIKFAKAAAKTASFSLLPSPSVTVSPPSLKKLNIASGSTDIGLGTIKVTSTSDFVIPAMTVSVVTEDESMQSWFTFSKSEIGPLQKRGDNDSVIVYISPPALEQDASIAGASKIILSSDVFTKPIPLELKVIKTNVALKVSLSTTAPVQIASASDGDGYETKLNVEYRLQNTGDVAIKDVEVSISPSTCIHTSAGSWVDFATSNRFDSIDPRATVPIKLKVSAPLTAESGNTMTCHLTTSYTNPVTGNITSLQRTDLIVLVK
ncbi:MAG: hypothetical protein Q7R47_03950 [Candidatus Diapherotrites archaeon]|nr:hypothetical protein [Candidatus Diapherotrites archaeon]